MVKTSGYGEDHWCAKLTFEQVKEMRKLRAENPELWTWAALGRKYAVNDDTVRRAIVGTTWKKGTPFHNPYKAQGWGRGHITTEGKAKIAELHAMGMKGATIAKRMGLSDTAVCNHIRALKKAQKNFAVTTMIPGAIVSS